MKTNVGTIDKVIRILIALVVIGLYFMHIITGALAIVLLVLGAIFIVTGLLNFCVLYVPFGINTSKKSK